MAMNKFVLTCWHMVASLVLLSAQSNPNPGLLWEDRSYERLDLYPVEVRGGLQGRKVNLTSYCPTPHDQCDQLSCVGWAIAQAMTIRWAKQSNKTDRSWIDAHLLSPAFIYNQKQIRAGQPCTSGAYLIKALEFVAKQGVCFFNTMPYECCCCEKQPDKAQQMEAAQNKITAFQRLYRLSDSPEIRLANTLTALDKGNPVIVAINITPDFKQIARGQKTWSPNREALLGGNAEGHALVAVGYDENAAVVTLFNSYGSDWADGGFVDMSFEEFKTQARYGIVVSIGRKD